MACNLLVLPAHSLSLVPPTLSRSYPTESRVLDSIRFPNIFTSATATMKTRYTPADWSQSKAMFLKLIMTRFCFNHCMTTHFSLSAVFHSTGRVLLDRVEIAYSQS